jgi:hypothetical protein
VRTGRLIIAAVLAVAVLAGAVAHADGVAGASPATHAAKKKKRKKPRRVCRRHERPHGKRPCLRPRKSAIRPRGVPQQGGPNDVMPQPTSGGLGGGPGDAFDKGEAAIEWARKLRGNHLYAWYCESFVENAFNVADKFKTAFAASQALDLKLRGAPPRGALVFFNPDDFNNHWGHVGISLGGWNMISALDSVQETDISSGYWRKAYAGWAYPPDDWPGRRSLSGAPDPHLDPTPGASIEITSPGLGDTLSGTVTFAAKATKASAVEFEAFYASDPANANTVGWHTLGSANTTGGGTWTLPYDTHAIPDQGNASWATVNIRATALDRSGNAVAEPAYRRVDVSNPPPPPPPPVAVGHYNCGNTANAFGHYVPGGKYWGNDFVAQGSTITGGSLAMGANVGDHDHSARIGIYTGPTRTGALGETVVQVVGYGGVNFTFSPAIHVTPGQQLWVSATGIGDFTAYDQNNGGADGCFIGHLDGFQ